MRAIVLSAGYGTRLWPLTEDRTKPAIPILGKPLVGYVAEYLAGYGFDEIVVNLHHRPESVRAALGDGSRFGVKLHYVMEEPEILGTSGALDNTREFFEHDTFLVVNGKIITDIDLRAALETHRRMKALATLVLLPNARRERFSVVETEEGRVTRFAGMPDPNATGPAPSMFTGIHIMEPRIFDYIPRGVFSDSVTHVYPKAMANGEIIAGHVASGRWRELSTLQRYLDISIEMLKGKGQSYVAGANSVVSPMAEVTDAIIWDNVEVSSGAVVNRCVLADNVRIPSGERVENSIVVRRDLVEGKTRPEKALPGRFQGENFVVPL
ncbi:MAG TPA: NDP-sugar synthase [Pyrinomonadaceae bacterium]|nr:NDP-sugar synthase [Pyrinomonadaceae bacterium]